MILSDDKTYVTVQKGDTLWAIAAKYLGSGTKYRQLAAIPKNNIKQSGTTAYWVYVGQKVYLVDDGGHVPPDSWNKCAVLQFGEDAALENTLAASWEFTRPVEEIANYKVLWTYDLGDGVERGKTETISVDKDAPYLAKRSTFQIQDGYRKVYFKVKPESKTYTDKNTNEQKTHWDIGWSEKKTYTNGTPLTAPKSAPSVKIEGETLTASLTGVDINGVDSIVFEVVEDAYVDPSANLSITKISASNPIVLKRGDVSYSCRVELGSKCKVRCKSYNTKTKESSDWSSYSASAETIPSAPAELKDPRATSETSIYLEWTEVPTAESYTIEYATEENYFDNTDKTTKKTGVELNHFEFIGLESGSKYYFRVCAVNKQGDSEWTEIKGVVIGEAPAAPTTWSSTTTAVVGESINLYWVHNSIDGSSQTYAELEFTIDGVLQQPTVLIENTASEDDKDKTSSYIVDTTQFTFLDANGQLKTLEEGVEIQWRVRTAGIALDTDDGGFGDWSTMRVIDVYAKPTLRLMLVDATGNQIGDHVDTPLSAFPVYVNALAGPKTQVPIGYHVSIVSNGTYETVDNIGNPRVVNVGESLYSKYFDTFDELMVELSPANIDLENSYSYTVICTVSMDSGLTAEESLQFTVGWSEMSHIPNAEIGVDLEAMTATIRPYCDKSTLVRYRVDYVNRVYTKTSEYIDRVYGELVSRARTTTGELVYSGTTYEGEELYYCEVVETSPITDVLFSVYRREYDGKFTEICKNIDGALNTAVTDPHPALDYARYRIVATSKTTGTVGYYDLPGHLIGCKSIIIQWNEEWSDFDATIDEILVQPNWAGSLLKLPYNIDVSESISPDVSFVKYAGREHPVGYYGTHLGETATWSTVIPKSDKETVYALRRLAKWMGNVYVREPSGVGYWANIKVSAPQKHLDQSIPVSLTITRVEGGI